MEPITNKEILGVFQLLDIETEDKRKKFSFETIAQLINQFGKWDGNLLNLTNNQDECNKGEYGKLEPNP
jgi:hypothetical protein